METGIKMQYHHKQESKQTPFQLNVKCMHESINQFNIPMVLIWKTVTSIDEEK